jgi:hypothetical protein
LYGLFFFLLLATWSTYLHLIPLRKFNEDCKSWTPTLCITIPSSILISNIISITFFFFKISLWIFSINLLTLIAIDGNYMYHLF